MFTFVSYPTEILCNAFLCYKLYVSFMSFKVLYFQQTTVYSPTIILKVDSTLECWTWPLLLSPALWQFIPPIGGVWPRQKRQVPENFSARFAELALLQRNMIYIPLRLWNILNPPVDWGIAIRYTFYIVYTEIKLTCILFNTKTHMFKVSNLFNPSNTFKFTLNNI